MLAFRPHTIEFLAYSSGGASVSSIPFRPTAGIDNLLGKPASPGMAPYELAIKRVADIMLTVGGLLLMSVPMLLIAMVIRLSSRGPALFRQERIGLNGDRFVMLKFRTMRHTVERPGIYPLGLCPQAIRHDPRVTWIGTLLRRTSFDELPQLLNVLTGSMSLVGPRPHAPGTCAAGRPFEMVSHRYAARHCVKPGMTGLAQVRGWRGETDTEEKLLRRIDSDLEYIATWSLRRDLLIICRTIITVLRMPNAY
jgi:lipopolysaccharide/colanic/teichoic acid biosynthesis glycosyltransferase